MHERLGRVGWHSARMKTSRARKTTGQADRGEGTRAMTMQELEQLCDDPAREKPGGVNVRALLNFEPDIGFYLQARDRDTLDRSWTNWATR